jgi:hypothetical protein
VNDYTAKQRKLRLKNHSKMCNICGSIIDWKTLDGVTFNAYSYSQHKRT